MWQAAFNVRLKFSPMINLAELFISWPGPDFWTRTSKTGLDLERWPSPARPGPSWSFVKKCRHFVQKMSSLCERKYRHFVKKTHRHFVKKHSSLCGKNPVRTGFTRTGFCFDPARPGPARNKYVLVFFSKRSHPKKLK